MKRDLDVHWVLLFNFFLSSIIGVFAWDFTGSSEMGAKVFLAMFVIGGLFEGLFTSDTVEEFIQLHREKFTEYWSLNENEERLLANFVDQFCRMISGQTEKEMMGKLIEDIASLDNADKGDDS